MPESLDLIHVSGGLIGTAILADALSDAPRRSEFGASSFAPPGETAETASGHAETVEAAWQLACERYDDVAAELGSMPVGRARDRWLLPLLELLDFAPAYQRAHLSSEDGRDRFAISHLGWQAADAPPIHLVASDLDDSAGRGQRTPHDEVQQYLNRARPLWGAVANGRRLRLVRDFHHLHLKAFVAFDLDAIFETRDFPAFRALYRLVHRSRFVPGEDDTCPLERLFQASQDQGVQIGQTLQRQVRKAIEALAEGLFDQELRRLLADPKEGRALYREVLIVLYRLLFLLFAEQRRMLPADGLYAETYSVTTLARLAETRAADPRHHDLWEGLKVTFRMLSEGAPEIGVFPYDGQLFDLSRTPRLVTVRCANRHLLEAIRALTRVRVGGVPQRVNYGELGVEELGSVYESLLNESLHVAERPTPIEDRMIPLGGVYLAPLGTERRDLGAYYTRPTLVDFALSVSIDPLIEERLAATGPEVAARERALLDLRICDPSCGSGAFLVGGIDRVALALATERAEGSKPTEDALRLARRDVLRHCIYGVDKDEFAVELCKVALWIHCAVPDLPLSFLDHRIQHGDSLVGWPLTGIPSTVSVEAYTVPSKIASSRQAGDRALAAFLRDAARRNQDWHQGQGVLGQELPRLPDIRVDFPALLTEDERVPADVARKSEAYAAYLRSPAYRRFKAAADLWTAAFFWGPEAGAEPPTGGDYLDALDGGADPAPAAAAEEILEEFPAFHWPIRFPEIRARGGFDAFVGNPPWEQVKPQEREWFATRAPEIAALPTARRSQAIEQLAMTNPALYRRWRQTVTAYARLAEYARRSERYRASGHEPNTYLLFTELVANGLRRNGRAGMIIKSALALDKSASGLFRHLVAHGQLAEFHDHINGARGSALIFPAVAAVERFAVVGLTGPGVGEGSFEATVMNWSIEEALDRPRQAITAQILRTLNPRTHTLTSFRRVEELEVALDIHRRLPILDLERGGDNPWGITYHRLFDSSLGQKYFLRREDLETEGWVLWPDKIFRRNAGHAPSGPPHQNAFDFASPAQQELELCASAGVEVALPIYEGQMVRRYDHRARTYEGYNGPNKYGRKPAIPETTDEQKADPTFEIEPRYWMDAGVAKHRFDSTLGERMALAFRDVGAPWTNQRSARGAVLPRVPATDKLPVFGLLRSQIFEFLGLFNSTLFDFLVRGHMPSGGVRLLWMLAQIPAPSPGLDPRIAELAEHLSLTSFSVTRLFNREPSRWDAEERYRIDVELDALIAHAYGITAAQYATVLDSFEVMARMQIKQHECYKFKDDCLATYRRLG